MLQLGALLLGLVGLLPLQLHGISLTRLLHCPRCGFSPQGFGSPAKGGLAHGTVCEHCRAQLGGPVPPGSPFSRASGA